MTHKHDDYCAAAKAEENARELYTGMICTVPEDITISNCVVLAWACCNLKGTNAANHIPDDHVLVYELMAACDAAYMADVCTPHIVHVDDITPA